ncbi:MAG: gliding motility-associated C-terminal domain-containing protein [Raineya sp.]
MLFYFLSLLFGFLANAQDKRTNNWFFGAKQGITFNTNPPSKLTDPRQNRFDESIATVSDKDGNLLFYTDGESVWNNAHDRMPNGNGLNGFSTTTQTLVVPIPDSEHLYYIFTASAQGGFFQSRPIGFYYSVVDMNLAGGLGDVITKNILLNHSTTEKIAATHHANGRDIWVMMHEWNNNVFKAYLLTPMGISTEPVTTAIGSIHTGGLGGVLVENTNAIGQMKFSPNGNMLALCISRNLVVDFFHFDKGTGKLSNFVTFSIDEDLNKRIYGIEFSTDNKKVYISYFNQIPPVGTGSTIFYIIQFNLEEIDFEKKELIIFEKKYNQATTVIGALQLASDGRIYCSHFLPDFFLFAIEQPNKSGFACQMNDTFLKMDDFIGLGLPNFVSSFLPNEDPDFRFPSREAILEMPNAFTPNGDGINDSFVPIISENITFSTLSIYNRWGKLIFQKDKEIAWSGEKYPAGVYYYHILYVGKDNQSKEAKGWLQMIK